MNTGHSGDNTSIQDLRAALRTWGEVFARSMMRNTIGYCRREGLTMPQVGTLFHLMRCGNSMVSAIGDHLGVTNAAVSQMLERLVQHGYVERLEDPEDRRARRISLTAKGKSVVRGSLEAGSQWLDGIAARLDPAERAGATRVLENLCALARVAEGPQSSAPTQ